MIAGLAVAVLLVLPQDFSTPADAGVPDAGSTAAVAAPAPAPVIGPLSAATSPATGRPPPRPRSAAPRRRRDAPRRGPPDGITPPPTGSRGGVHRLHARGRRRSGRLPAAVVAARSHRPGRVRSRPVGERPCRSTAGRPADHRPAAERRRDRAGRRHRPRRLDGDPAYDHAVGPMQFIPSTWARYASDGNGDGRADPFNVYDAALAAARYLCAAGGDLGSEAGQARAVLAYNHSASYVATVLTLAAAYVGRRPRGLPRCRRLRRAHLRQPGRHHRRSASPLPHTSLPALRRRPPRPPRAVHDRVLDDGVVHQPVLHDLGSADLGIGVVHDGVVHDAGSTSASSTTAGSTSASSTTAGSTASSSTSATPRARRPRARPPRRRPPRRRPPQRGLHDGGDAHEHVVPGPGGAGDRRRRERNGSAGRRHGRGRPPDRGRAPRRHRSPRLPAPRRRHSSTPPPSSRRPATGGRSGRPCLLREAAVEHITVVCGPTTGPAL